MGLGELKLQIEELDAEMEALKLRRAFLLQELSDLTRDQHMFYRNEAIDPHEEFIGCC